MPDRTQPIRLASAQSHAQALISLVSERLTVLSGAEGSDKICDAVADTEQIRDALRALLLSAAPRETDDQYAREHELAGLIEALVSGESSES